MIVDANVAFKWLVAEPLSDQADALLARDDLIAPDIIDYEIAQVVSRHARNRLLNRAAIEAVVQGLDDAPPRRIGWRAYASMAMPLSLDLRATFAHCLYLALAVDRDDQLVTADEHFVRAVRAAPAMARFVISLRET
jgi:predicted nucleic acid-binding protein